MRYMTPFLVVPLITLASCILASSGHTRSSKSHRQYINATVQSDEKTDSAVVTFNATSNNNLAVYYGSTNEARATTLFLQCNDTNVDIVVLSFVTEVIGAGGYPTIAFNQLCSGQTQEMIAANATGLYQCDSLASQITQCQALGTKVFLSIGGAKGNTTFKTSTEASTAAQSLWDIFGSGTGVDSGLRPFGDNVTIDGIDIDNETGVDDHYTDFVNDLRTLFTSQSKKTYYISAAPSCYFPSLSEPLDMLNLVDFVWPQFYGAPSCNIGTSNYSTSFSNWVARLDGPKIYVGGVSWPNGTSNGGYEDPAAFKKTVSQSRKAAGTKFGGVTLWDGAYAQITLNSAGENFIETTKEALNS